MNDRQQRAQASIMGIIAALPWTERARVVRAVNRNDEICLKCGRVTERWGDCRCVPLPPDVTITHVIGHEGDLWVSWGQWRELPNNTENDKRVHAFKCEDGRVWDAVNGWRGPARRLEAIDGTGWAEAAFSDDVDPSQRAVYPDSPSSVNANMRRQMANTYHVDPSWRYPYECPNCG